MKIIYITSTLENVGHVKVLKVTILAELSTYSKSLSTNGFIKFISEIWVKILYTYVNAFIVVNKDIYDETQKRNLNNKPIYIVPNCVTLGNSAEIVKNSGFGASIPTGYNIILAKL